MTLTCDISGSMGSNLLSWSYDGVTVINIVPAATTLPAIWVVSGVEFTVLDTQMDTVSQISFVASVMMSGRTLGCGGNGQTGTVTFHVDSVVGMCMTRVCGVGVWREIGALRILSAGTSCLHGSCTT